MYDYKLLALINAAQHKSFSSAASAMNISTSALIKQIEALEQRWNTKLFNRNSGGIELTEDGVYMYNWSLKFINKSKEIEKRLPSNQIGFQTIRIANCQIYFPQKLRENANFFCDQRNDCLIKIFPYFDSDSLMIDLEGVLKRFDIVFYLNCFGKLDDSIMYVPICYSQLICAVKRNSSLSPLNEIGVENLRGHTVGFFAEGVSKELSQVKAKLQSATSGIIFKDRNTDISSNEENEVVIIPETYAFAFTHMKLIPMSADLKITAGLFTRKDSNEAILDFMNFCKRKFMNALYFVE